ncbi:hypothetical protein GOP47_0016856 [Adiantum capillus-veneris]|uniref:Uncharacterized protein n=1 Tax=Adiantum capillus-veneris TaxID=13818 RepID=A0A9D4UIH3_ADICA|nr:hypothetical protein GOP47_0016856 [Adiantum capillus-veneris]
MAGAGPRGEQQVSVRGRAIVVPATPTPPHKRHLFLSCFDVIWAKHHYNQRLLFYEGNAFSSSTIADLKSSLALCLVHYYPWCGRLVNGQKWPLVRPFIDCNDAGVEFVEASVDLPMSELSSCGFQMQPFFEDLCQRVDPAEQDSPLLSIQATLFSDGGLSLGISQSHVVADGQALWNFMVSWSECARELPLSLPPLLDREILALPNPSPEKANWKFYATRREEDMMEPQAVGTASIHMDQDLSPAGTASPLDEPPILVQSLFILPFSAINQLKLEDGGVHTSYEVICAHLWKHVSMARQRPSHEPTNFFVLANCRTRLKPPLPSTYFGNAIWFDICSSSIGKICSESLHATSSRIHDTVVAIMQDSLVGFRNWVEIPGNDLLEAIFPHIPKGTGINVASSPRFPVYDVDFGWGRPSAVRSAKVPGDGEVVLFSGNPKLDRRDVEFCVCLPKDALQSLLKDPKFLGKPPRNLFAEGN